MYSDITLSTLQNMACLPFGFDRGYSTKLSRITDLATILLCYQENKNLFKKLCSLHFCYVPFIKETIAANLLKYQFLLASFYYIKICAVILHYLHCKIWPAFHSDLAGDIPQD